MRELIILVSLLYFGIIEAQVTDFRYENATYVDHIQSVELRHESIPLSMPIVDLGTAGRLSLDFDDREGNFKTYRYKIIHCDKDWYPSELDEIDYISGFNDEEIDEYNYSSNAYSEYTHYQLSLPNDDLTWTISGNYLLIVYEDETDFAVLTRRFIVAEKAVNIQGGFIKPQNVLNYYTHHELNLKVDYSNFRINNPLQNLFIHVLQNGDWNRSILNRQASFQNGNSIVFDDPNPISFPGLKEFRNFDTRTIKSRSEFVYSIDQDDETVVLLDLGKIRPKTHYDDFRDANGGYIIDNLDNTDPNVTGEYCKVIFTLETDPFVEDVYIVGDFCNWKAHEKLKMEYDYDRRIYFKSAYFKQGFYDYMYGLKRDDGSLDLDIIEGSSFQTENDYIIIAYYRDFISQYDRVIDVANMNSAADR